MMHIQFVEPRKPVSTPGLLVDLLFSVVELVGCCFAACGIGVLLALVLL